MRIRAAVVADAAEIARLSAQLGYPAETAAFARRLAFLTGSPRHAVLVADGGDGRLQGFAGVEHRVMIEMGERVEIVGLVVDAQARRGGVGRALMAAAEQWAREAGVHEIFLGSNVVRPEAHAFYPSLGYARVKTQHSYLKRL
ncbi:GNAT family N-acetyltransferase [Luteimonas aquatica]|uniref:GNAT family N-acetyltransferase n=1 Tax=Luteimonas aquatica TaxID=450364 RepID=UPI001F575643|nr:GNAT family N-acetyltransferase [Luteimonas aquatica]